jgi:uncharacterized protein (DUF1501 family)
MTRRDLLKLLSAVPALWLAPNFLKEPWTFSHAQDPSAQGNWNHILVLVELHGGNDGLNTIIPFSEPTYYDLRPSLAIPRNQALHLTPKLGFHPAFKSLMPLWENRELAIVSGVGYPHPNRSHFRSIEIWETGSHSQEFLQDGWLNRVFAQYSPPQAYTADAIQLSKGDTGPMSGGSTRTIALQDPQQFFKESKRVHPISIATTNPALQHLLKIQREISRAGEDLQHHLQQAPAMNHPFPQSKIGRQLETAAKLIMANVPVAVIKVTQGSFDTHARQANSHQRLLKELAEALSAFRTAMHKQRLWNNILIMTYSEFGRRVKENASKGTDHGTAAPHFLIGGKVKGGFYGSHPSLTNLHNGDLQHTVDYRSLYTTVLQHWWKLPATTFDKRTYPPINCLS